MKLALMDRLWRFTWLTESLGQKMPSIRSDFTFLNTFKIQRGALIPKSGERGIVEGEA